MPVFNYLCENCGFKKTVFKLNSKSISCKNCNGIKMKKQIGTPAFQLKGRGFYINDYPKRKR